MQQCGRQKGGRDYCSLESSDRRLRREYQRLPQHRDVPWPPLTCPTTPIKYIHKSNTQTLERQTRDAPVAAKYPGRRVSNLKKKNYVTIHQQELPDEPAGAESHLHAAFMRLRAEDGRVFKWTERLSRSARAPLGFSSLLDLNSTKP